MLSVTESAIPYSDVGEHYLTWTTKRKNTNITREVIKSKKAQVEDTAPAPRGGARLTFDDRAELRS